MVSRLSLAAGLLGGSVNGGGGGCPDCRFVSGPVGGGGGLGVDLSLPNVAAWGGGGTDVVSREPQLGQKRSRSLLSDPQLVHVR